MEETVRKEGEAAAFELGLYDLHPEVLRLMGRLKFRTSYGQNVLNHSKEVAFLAGIMAQELGLNAQVATRAAFLHDIGKAIDRDLQGTHLELGLDFLRKHGESEPGRRWRWPPITWTSTGRRSSDDRAGRRRDLRGAAGRPARHPRVLREAPREARRHRRLLPGRVEGLRAPGRPRDPHPGRERADLDEETVWLSKDIARRIENELEYPGQIKVTVIRETRAVDYAR